MWFGTLIALILLIAPGAIVARIAQLSWPIAIAVGPPLTYGVVALAIIPYGALGIPWNGWTALAALAIVCVVATGLQLLLGRFRDAEAEARTVSGWPAVTVAAGVALGALLIGWAAIAGIPHWQSIPSTWDAVWHANTVRFILDTGQASSTHMGELRNVETHAALYYPSVFHGLVAVFCQLTGAAPTTGYTLSSLAAAVWLFPVSAAVLTWRALRTHAGPYWSAPPQAGGARTSASPFGSALPASAEWRTAGASATAAALSASFTAVPYVEFDTAAMPNLVAYGIAAPAMLLIASTLQHRDRIPMAVLALVGVFSVHITGGVVVVLLVGAWWAFEALWHPVRGRLADLLTLAGVAVTAGLILLPQFLSVTQQEDIIAGHSFLTYLSKKRGVFDAVFQHSRHLNDFPVQYALIVLAAFGGFIFLVTKIWWPLAVWLLLIVANVDAGTPLGGPIGALAGTFGEFFYKDPRRIAAATTLLLVPMAGVGLFTAVMLVVALAKRLPHRFRPVPARAGDDRQRGEAGRSGSSPSTWAPITAALLVAATVVSAWHYFPRHRFLFGDKYDSVMVDQKDLDAMAYLAKLPGARDTLIGNGNTDGTAWMYAVAGLHPLWTHYDYPVQMGPGYHRFIFWAYARNGTDDPRVVESVKVLNIRYILTSLPIVRGFVAPDGLVSLEKSKSWAKIYDNGGARIYEWRGK
ncbi:membrane protein [Mycobacterium lacus]|uniref:Membrane protein n=1 Tax=Mycobacterium lacus TaxID=169765 RepID=A0A7I7NSB9_9MYCO|nr:membrane protein [Mycobacterium lacus]